MKTTTKRFLILFVAVMAMMVNANAKKVPYATLSDSTLTFRCGELPTGQNIYDMSNEKYYDNWASVIESVKKVTIDSSFEEVRLKSCAQLFYKMSNLESIEGLQYLNTSEVANMEMMFSGCKKLTYFDVSGFNTSNVTDMSSMFNGCSNLANIDVSGFNTSNVTDMKLMFSSCNKLASLDVSGFNTSNVTDMHYMFAACRLLTSLDVSGFSTSNVTDMDGMFSECSSLTSLDVSGFKTSNVTNMNSMFNKCKLLTTLDVSGFNTSNVTDMGSMFYECSSLKTLDVSGFNTSNVTNMNSMFKKCKLLTSLAVNVFKTSNVTDMSSMFYECSSLKTLDVSGFNTSNVTDMSSMFYECSSLKTLDVSGFNTSNVTNMHEMFDYCIELTSLDVSGFKTTEVTDMGYMFFYCKLLTSLDVSRFNTSKVTNMNSMFFYCKSLTSLDVSGFNTLNVMDMKYMFSFCSKLTSLDVRNFNTSNVTDMRQMFYYCDSLTTIYCNDKWTCGESADMFKDCGKLKGAISYSSSKTDATYANPETGYFRYMDYDLWVNGTQVTHKNCNDLSGINGVSGAVSYDKYTNTLILDNATITATGSNTTFAIHSDLPNLKIQVKDNSTLEHAYGGGIKCSGSLELSGIDAGSLSISGTSAVVMTSEKENRLNVKDLNLTLDGTSYYGVTTTYGKTVMEIQGNSEVKTRGVNECYSNLKDIIIPEGYAVTEPIGAYISGGKVLDTDGSSVKNEWVTIVEQKRYDLWVGGVQVNEANCSNITGSNIKQGTATYDDETKTLTLTDCSIGMDYTTGTIGIKSRMDSLAIHLVGNNGISMVDTGIESTGDVTIAGPGKLNLVFCNTGIYMTEISPNDLLVTDGAKLNMTLVGTGVLGKKMTTRIGNNNVTLYSKNLCVSGGMSDVSIIASTSAISDINKLVLSDGLSLSAPVGAKFASHTLKDKDGNVVKDKNVRISLVGDVNNDGAVTMADANAVVNYFLATDKPSDFDVDNANVNGDGDDDGKPAITMADANQIVNMFLGGK